jgi:hypothetical protein
MPSLLSQAHAHLSWTHDDLPPMEFVPGSAGTPPYPERFADQLVVDVIHDGRMVPRDFLFDGEGRPQPEEAWEEAWHSERDWGAAIVAERIAERLGLPGFWNVNTARCLMDFGRFPGITGGDSAHLRRFAINLPFAGWLSFAQKRRVLEEQYDRISATMERAVRGRMLKIAVHTYDRRNRSGTERPAVSIVSRALSYQVDSQLPVGLFDPLYPDILAELTIDRILGDRISLTLEKAGVPVAHNYPYLLPEGSTEVRHQVWAFFDWLERRYATVHPDSAADPAFRLVWDMVKDTNLRSSEAMTLRSFLHMFRRPPEGLESLYMQAEAAYRQIERFLRAQDSAVVEEYRHSAERAMSFGVEIRKDLLWRMDERGRPIAFEPERALYAADQIARAISIYLTEDWRDDRSPRFAG